jgi:hypothetical protein
MSRLFIVAKLCARDWPMALVWGGYFLANTGLLLAR